MTYDNTSILWTRAKESFFHHKTFKVVQQSGPHCVSTVLGILTGTSPEEFQQKINTQNPVTWSEALRKWNMKLAYCPTDIRKLKHYMKELVALDDLFTLCYYTTNDPEAILGDPDISGWLTGSHIVLLHRNKILDPKYGIESEAFYHECNEYHTKRIFRVVPVNHVRGL
jgi:hypothetical protein